MKIAWLLIVSTGLYLLAAGQSLWLDEAISANVAKRWGYGELVKDFSPYDFHPPGYYLMLKTVTGILGYSEIAIRLPSTLFCLVTIFVVYKIGGLGPAMLTAFNPLLVYYSHEARMYALVTMLITMAIYFWHKEKPVWTGLFCGLSFLVFYGSVFVIMAMVIDLVWKRKWLHLWQFGIGPALALLIVSPLLWQQLKYSNEMLSQVTNWSLVLGKVNLKNLMLIPIKFTSGRISFYPKLAYVAVALLWAVAVWWQMKRDSNYSRLFWMILVIGVIFSIFTPMLQYFRFLYLIPLMALAIGHNRLISTVFAICSLIYVINPQFHREDWRSVTAGLGDKVYMVESFGDPVRYYRPEINIVDIRGEVAGENVTVIPYGEIIHGVNHIKILEDKGYKMFKTNSYREVTSEVWKKLN